MRRVSRGLVVAVGCVGAWARMRCQATLLSGGGLAGRDSPRAAIAREETRTRSDFGRGASDEPSAGISFERSSALLAVCGRARILRLAAGGECQASGTTIGAPGG